MCVIEEKIKIFDLIKNIVMENGGGKSIFLYGNADFSEDIKKYAVENGVLIFRYINPNPNPGHMILSVEQNPPETDIDLVVAGDCRNGVNNAVARLGTVKSILLNIGNLNGTDLNRLGIDGDIQIITCGFKEKDTAIFSSINLEEGNVILDLQRSVKNINGETLEPFEKQIGIPERIKKYPGLTTEDLILSMTALTLCGRL